MITTPSILNKKQKKKKVRDPEISFPSLKKVNTGVSSPRSPIVLPPMMNIMTPVPKDIPETQNPDELIVTGLEDVIKKRSPVCFT